MFESFLGKAAAGAVGAYATSRLVDAFGKPDTNEQATNEEGMISGFLSMIGLKGSPETKVEAAKVTSEATAEREGIFEGAFGSAGKIGLSALGAYALAYGVPKLLEYVNGTTTTNPETSPTSTSDDNEKTGFWSWLTGSSKETQNEVKEVQKSAWNERGDVLRTVLQGSVLNRYAPGLSAFLNIGENIIGNTPEELYSWQNEFNVITALLRFVPDVGLSIITDPFKNSTYFRKLAEEWPGFDEKTLENPEGVIDFIRIIHGDLISGGNLFRQTYREVQRVMPDSVEGFLPTTLTPG